MYLGDELGLVCFRQKVRCLTRKLEKRGRDQLDVHPPLMVVHMEYFQSTTIVRPGAGTAPAVVGFFLSRMNTHPLLSLIFPPLALLLRLGLVRRSVCLTPALGFAWRLGNASESRVQMGS
jgi:hypothetical protein